MIRSQALCLNRITQKYQFNAEIVDDELILRMITKQKDTIHYYSKYLFDSLPAICQTICSCVLEVFQMFNSQDSYQLNYEKGEVTLKFQLIRQGKKIPKQAILALQKLDLSQPEKISIDLKRLSVKVAQLEKAQTYRSEQLSKQLQDLSNRVEIQWQQTVKRVQMTQKQIEVIKQNYQQKIELIGQKMNQQLAQMKKQIKQIYGSLFQFKTFMTEFQADILEKVQVLGKKNQESKQWKKDMQTKIQQLQEIVFQPPALPYTFSEENHHKDFIISSPNIILSGSNISQKIATIEPMFRPQIKNYQIKFQANRCSDWVGIGICQLPSVKKHRFRFPLQENTKCNIYLVTHNGSTFSKYKQGLWNTKCGFFGFSPFEVVTVIVNTESRVITYLKDLKKYELNFAKNLPIQSLCFCIFMDRKNDQVQISGQMPIR